MVLGRVLEGDGHLACHPAVVGDGAGEPRLDRHRPDTEAWGVDDNDIDNGDDGGGSDNDGDGGGDDGDCDIDDE
jgi:hypothetical protein